MRIRRPNVLVLEWWTAATCLLGMRVVIELHELQDPVRLAY